jgi:hypothetical protein
MRICNDVKGNPKQYMTRSPNFGTAYIWAIGNGPQYGDSNGYCIADRLYGIRIMISI